MYREYVITPETTIKDSLKIMDKVSNKVLFIEKKKKLVGALSDGDIRRSLLKNINLNEQVVKIMNPTPFFVKEDYAIDEVKKVMLDKEIQIVPVLNNKREIIDILFWHIIFGESKIDFKQINIPVIIMAGGTGTRLDPFTRILPKPLIPIGDKAMIEVIMDEFAKYGMRDFYISINHKARMIRAFFEDHESDYTFEYITEDQPLGTAGAIKYLDGRINKPFFVSNCDILIKEDYTKFYDFHKNNDFQLTLVASMQTHIIPYGVCEIENGGSLKGIIEKPQYDFMVNTGMYLLNFEVLKYIPENKFFNMTDLIRKLKDNNESIGVYPVLEKSWIDVGQWTEYKENIGRLL